MTSGRALAALIAGSTLLRLAWAANFGPINDEAYHYLFAVHPDWSYFDHPPMLALVERAGLAVGGGVVSALVLRLGFVGLFAGSTFLMARLAGRFYGPRAGFLAALVLNVSAYFGIAAGTFALPDGPLLFFWLLTLDALAMAMAMEGSGRNLGRWAWVGLAWGGALLSKYHAVFLPAGAVLYLVAEPSARVWLRRPGPYLAVLLGVVVFSPVIGWNVAHGWASFAFQGGRAVGRMGFRLDSLAAAVFWPAAYLFPWVWVFLVGALGGLATRPGRSAADRFLLCQAAVPLATFLAVACVRPVLPHWTLVGFLPLMPVLGRDWAERFPEGSPRLRRRLATMLALPAGLALLAAVHARTGVFQGVAARLGGEAAVAHDLTADQATWEQVGEVLRRKGLVGAPGTFLFTGRWYQSGQLAMAVGGRAPVLCYNVGDSRGFAFWSRPEDWVHRDGILVCLGERSTEPGAFDKWFRTIEPLGEFPVMRGGRAVRKVRLFRCVGQTWPFPFAGLPSRLAGVSRDATRR